MITSRRMRWAEAWALTSELLRDPYSHVSAAVNGWPYVPAPDEVAAYFLLEGWANAKKPPNSTVIKLDRPWLKTVHVVPVDEKPAVGEEHLDQRRRHLGLVPDPAPDPDDD